MKVKELGKFGKIKGQGEVIRSNGVREPIEFEAELTKENIEALQKQSNVKDGSPSKQK